MLKNFKIFVKFSIAFKMDILLALYWSHIPLMQDCHIYTYLSMTFVTEIYPRQVISLIDAKKLCVQLQCNYQLVSKK